MKHSISILLVAAIALLFASCRKSDLITETATTSEITSVATSEWHAGTWQSAKGKSSTVNYFVITDNALSTAADGMVIVFKKSGTSVRTLPFEEKVGNHTIYWFYQISGNTITINKQGGTEENSSSNDLFNHIVISANQLEQLTVKGYTYQKLMGLSIEEIKAIL